MAEVDELSGLFVEIEDFEEDEDEDPELLTNNGIDGVAKFLPAKNIETDEQVICKVFNPEPLKSNSVGSSTSGKDQCSYKQLLLMREAIYLKELRHPTIVDIKGLNLFNYKIKFEDDDDDENIEFNPNPTIFLEFLKNKSLSNLIKEKTKLPAYKRQIIMIGMSAAVRYIHSKGVMHRSLNPLTIWLDENDRPKIFDFSTSRHSEKGIDVSKTSLQPSGAIYKAPELADGSANYDTPIDIFALGRLLYLMATGYEAFKHPDDKLNGKGEFFIYNLVVQNNAIPYFPNDLPKKLVRLITRCWANNPNERPTAEGVCQFIAEKTKYYIGKFTEDQLSEINDYWEMIQKYERDHTEKKLRVKRTFSLHIPFSDPIPEGRLEKIPTEPSAQIQMLAKITSSNFAYCSEDLTLSLLNLMADNKSILHNDELLKVSNFVNTMSERNHSDALKFLEKIYGKYVIDSKSEKAIKKGTVKDKTIEVANIPPWVTIISRNAFSDFPNLTRVNIPNSVKEIEMEAFKNCPKLTVVNIPDSIVERNLGKFAFMGCTSLKYVRLPRKLKRIEEGTFKGDKALQYVTLNNELEVIGKEAFQECRAIESIIIPKSVVRLSDRAFQKCKNLKTLYLRGKRPLMGNGAVKHGVHKTSI